MAFHIRDPETDTLVRAFAAQERVGLTEAVKLAVKRELERGRRRVPLRERVRPIQARIAAAPDTGLRADKAFFDELSGD
jgi:antitoxin VapB